MADTMEGILYSVDEKRSGWQASYTGTPYYPEAPKPADVHIKDIARGLSSMARYGGMTHLGKDIWVASHSVVVSRHVHPRYQLQALVHDAPEAYIGDMRRPLKEASIIGKIFKEYDLMNHIAISIRLGLPITLHESVIAADNLIVGDEQIHAIPKQALPWGVEKGLGRLGVEEGDLVGMDPSAAFWMFMDRFDELVMDPSQVRVSYPDDMLEMVIHSSEEVLKIVQERVPEALHLAADNDLLTDGVAAAEQLVPAP